MKFHIFHLIPEKKRVEEEAFFENLIK